MSLTPEQTLDQLAALTCRVDQLEVDGRVLRGQVQRLQGRVSVLDRRLTTIEQHIQAGPAVQAIAETIKDLARLQEAVEHWRDRVESAR